ncbi:DUF4255 domain-containing protein [Marinobacterium sp. YM272]|uniref:DUF4255 domain-containing protein n=1 Tax=Marinobacterium sp. YM272 TaxID=3421654 RepID=UPI003D7F96CC
MISDALDYIRVELRDYLSIADAEISVGHLHNLVNHETSPGLRIGLVNVSEEATLRNLPHSQRSPGGQVEYQQPPVHLNCFVMFAFDFGTYQTDLIRLSQSIEMFQAKRYWDSTNQRAENPFPANLDRLLFELNSTDFEQLNHLWGILGGTYFPSVLYKMRLIKVQADEQQEGPEITSIEVNTEVKVS